MNKVKCVLFFLLIMIQIPLWFGAKGWINVARLKHRLHLQEVVNAANVLRNIQLKAEVMSLRQGNGMRNSAVEELARNELGLVQKNEISIQVFEN